MSMLRNVCVALGLLGLMVAADRVETSVLQAQDGRLAPIPMFEVDPAWPKVPAKWKLGDASSFAIDAQDNVWLLHRPRTLAAEDAAMAAPPVMVFNASGDFIKAWGGAGIGYEWPEREHGIHVDSKGFVWLGGNNCPTNGIRGLKPVADDQLLKFRPEGKLVLQIGRSNQSKGNADTRTCIGRRMHWCTRRRTRSSSRTAMAITGSRVRCRFGRLQAHVGRFRRQADDDDHCEVVTPKTSRSPARQFQHRARSACLTDGLVYVADRENRRVQVFTLDGKFVKQLVKPDIPFARNLALSHDPEQKFLYVGNGDTIAIVDRMKLELIATFRPGPGFRNAGHQIATDSKGNLYVAQTTMGMQKLIFKGISPGGIQ